MHNTKTGIYLLNLGLLIALLLVPQMLSRFYVYLTSLILVTGLLATSLNMVLGFGGMYQFHHAVFYGVGAYTVGLLMTKGGASPWLAVAAAPATAALLSALIGAICVRLSKLYFGMLQISLGSLVWAIVYRWYDFTGGDDGIHGLYMPDAIGSTQGAYFFVLGVTGICLIFMYRIVNSPFGRIFQAIRDNPDRCRSVGINVTLHQWVGMIIAGAFAGMAGALFVVVEGSVFPELMFWQLSLEILIMCLLGGWFTFLGPMLGAGVMVTLRTIAGIYTEYWTLILGLVLMALIFALPQGVLGYFLERFAGSDNVAEEEA